MAGAERGQSLLWVAGVVLLTVALCLGGAHAGSRARAEARAGAVADLVALAAALDGEAGAARVAGSNGGRVESVAVVGDTVTVTVEVDGHRATASARAVVGGEEGPLVQPSMGETGPRGS